jgi:23S rRNA (pseudouridine1915-N3)-methyltransferase
VRLKLVAAGTRMPGWVAQGFDDYAARMPRDCRLELTEIPLGRRSRSADPARAVNEEGARMLAAAKACLVVTLEVDGEAVGTAGLARRLADWLGSGQDVALLVGGPDGLSPECRSASRWRWSLSALTLPHGLVRVVAAEALYRAWTVLANHPYHRE